MGQPQPFATLLSQRGDAGTLRHGGSAIAPTVRCSTRTFPVRGRSRTATSGSTSWPLGFDVLFEAEWVALPVDHELPDPAIGGPAWATVRSDADLLAWERALHGESTAAASAGVARVFGPALLDDPDIRFLAGITARPDRRRGGRESFGRRDRPRRRHLERGADAGSSAGRMDPRSSPLCEMRFLACPWWATNGAKVSTRCSPLAFDPWGRCGCGARLMAEAFSERAKMGVSQRP